MWKFDDLVSHSIDCKPFRLVVQVSPLGRRRLYVADIDDQVMVMVGTPDEDLAAE